MTEPHCSLCGCSHFDPCPDGCDWAKVPKDEGPLCTVCAWFVGQLDDYFQSALNVSALSLTRALRIVKGRTS